jgi:hypothetical protein
MEGGVKSESKIDGNPVEPLWRPTGVTAVIRSDNIPTSLCHSPRRNKTYYELFPPLCARRHAPRDSSSEYTLGSIIIIDSQSPRRQNYGLR